jgi:hypothetical protein
MSIGVHRHFDAVRIYIPGHSYHLNFNRLVAAVDLLRDEAIPGRISEQLREQFPELSPKEIHDYFCAAQAVVSNGVNLSEVRA